MKDPKIIEAHGEGYAEGSDSRLLTCYLNIVKYLHSPYLDDTKKIEAIQRELRAWRNELLQRNKFPGQVSV